MAASVSIRVMEDGPRNAVLWIEGNNGASGADPGSGGVDLASTQLILPSGLGYVDEPKKQRCQGVRIDLIEWDIQTEASMRVDLFWDAATPSIAYSLIGRANKDFKDFGGLYPPSGLTTPTGGLKISTTNAPATYAAYTITLRVVKLLPNP